MRKKKSINTTDVANPEDPHTANRKDKPKVRNNIEKEEKEVLQSTEKLKLNIPDPIEPHNPKKKNKAIKAIETIKTTTPASNEALKLNGTKKNKKVAQNDNTDKVATAPLKKLKKPKKKIQTAAENETLKPSKIKDKKIENIKKTKAVISTNKKAGVTKKIAKIATNTKAIKKQKAVNTSLLKRMNKIENMLKKISGQLKSLAKPTRKHESNKMAKKQVNSAGIDVKKTPINELTLATGKDLAKVKIKAENVKKTSEKVKLPTVQVYSSAEEMLKKTVKQPKIAIHNSHINKILEKNIPKKNIQPKVIKKPQNIKEPKNNSAVLDVKESISPKNDKRKRVKPVKEKNNWSFRFKVFFNRTDDEKNMKEKSEKIAAYINLYLGSQGFLKKNGLASIATTNLEVVGENILPVLMEPSLRAEKKECVFKFTINLIRDNGTRIDEKSVGSIVECIQEKFFHIETAGWCSGFVYDVRNYSKII